MARLFYTVAVGFQLISCTPKPEQPYYFLERTETSADGSSITWIYSGSKPPPAWEREEPQQATAVMTAR